MISNSRECIFYLEVSQRYRNTGRYRQNDDENEQKDTVKCVLLSPPDGGENVVDLHRDRGKGQKAAKEAVADEIRIPRLELKVKFMPNSLNERQKNLFAMRKEPNIL